jgi:hypothetical protein
LIYICTWSTKNATGTIKVDGRTVKEAKFKAFKALRDGYGIKASAINPQPQLHKSGVVRPKSRIFDKTQLGLRQ